MSSFGKIKEVATPPPPQLHDDDDDEDQDSHLLLLAAAASPRPPPDPPPPPPPPPLSSTPRTFANLVLCIIGAGVLGLPYTFSLVGWAAGAVILCSSGAVTYFGMMLLIWTKRRLLRCSSELITVLSYGDLMYYTFGRGGRILVDVLVTLNTIACGTSFLTFISQNLASMASSLIQGNQTPSSTFLASEFKSLQDIHVLSSDVVAHDGGLRGISWTSSYLYTWMIFPLEVALAAIPYITYLAPLSTVGDALNLTALAAVMVSDVAAIRMMGGFQSIKMVGTWVAMPSAFGVGVYAFQAAAMMIPIETAMAEPLKLGLVLCAAFILSGALYTAFAVLGYAAFGDSTQQIITLNLEDGVEALLIKTAICIALFFAFPLNLIPMCELVERRFSRRKMSLVLRAAVVFLICLLATAVKHFADFLSLAGSSVCCLVGFIIPAAVHLKVISKDVEQPATTAEIAADYFLIVFGLLFGAAGTYVSFLNLL